MTTPEQILIYDGDCAFCTSCVAWLQRRWNATTPPTAVDYQSIVRDGVAYATPSREEMQRALWWLDGNGAVQGAEAVSRALRATSGLWRLVGHLINVAPISWVAPWTYRRVAKYRHHLPGASPTCRLPSDT
jgi:predicted DCC family thiol-disulfide oxidoreductase YuxK